MSVHPFKIGSRGYISPSNKANLKKLHKFSKPSVSFKAMCKNLSSLAVLSGKVLHSMKEGVQFNGVTIMALFFADDLQNLKDIAQRDV